MKSKKALFTSLDQFFGTDRFSKDKLTASGIGNETYGNDSRIYVATESVQVRNRLEAALINQGFDVQLDYFIGSSTVEVRVPYFKGMNYYK
jgi:hypothetical protein